MKGLNPGFDSADADYPAEDTRRGTLGQSMACITWWGSVDPYRRAGTSPSFTVDLDPHWLQAGRGQQAPTGPTPSSTDSNSPRDIVFSSVFSSMVTVCLRIFLTPAHQTVVRALYVPTATRGK